MARRGFWWPKVRPARGQQGRCSRCGRRCGGYDRGEGRRRWRTLDLRATQAYLEADAPRVRCPDHGVVVAAVPWARGGARFTRSFEDQCAWLATHAPASVVAELLRITWRTVTTIVTRVVADARGSRDMLDGLVRIEIDELAHRKGQRYIDTLGEDRVRRLTHVSADGAEWIHNPVRRRAPQAVICLDAFHVVAWATKASTRSAEGCGTTCAAAGTRPPPPS